MNIRENVYYKKEKNTNKKPEKPEHIRNSVLCIPITH